LERAKERYVATCRYTRTRISEKKGYRAKEFTHGEGVRLREVDRETKVGGGKRKVTTNIKKRVSREGQIANARVKREEWGRGES
jgi:hypothetical protein